MPTADARRRARWLSVTIVMCALETRTLYCYCECPILSSSVFLFHFSPTFRLASSPRKYKRDRVETLTQCADWYEFAFQYFSKKNKSPRNFRPAFSSVRDTEPSRSNRCTQVHISQTGGDARRLQRGTQTGQSGTPSPTQTVSSRKELYRNLF